MLYNGENPIFDMKDEKDEIAKLCTGGKAMYQIIQKKRLNESVTLMKIHAPYVARKARAGQFIIFRVDEMGERIPLTIADYDREEGSVTIIFQEVGYSTKLLGSREAGEFIADFVGPLGNASEFDGVKRAIVVGGGVGCAIAYPQAKALHAMGAQVVTVAGFRSKDIVILEEEMRAASSALHLATDDGSYGRKGFVTQILSELLEQDAGYDLVVAIGPVPMMQAVCDVTKPYGIHTVVSLNPIMIDGTGMCGGCRVTVGGKLKYACVDGPDFDGHQVDFAELSKRNRTYQPLERESAGHACRLFAAAGEEGHHA